MSDGDKASLLYDGMPVITFNDAIRFFLSVTPDGKCFACGADRWEISARESDVSLCFLHPAGGRLSGQKAFNLNIDCSNCGLVRVHRAETIQRWLEENPDTAEVQDEHI